MAIKELKLFLLLVSYLEPNRQHSNVLPNSLRAVANVAGRYRLFKRVNYCERFISGFHRAFLKSITFIGRLMHLIV